MHSATFISHPALSQAQSKHSDCCATLLPEVHPTHPFPMAKTLLPIKDVARKLEIPDQYVEQVSSYGAKIRLELLNDPAFAKPRGRMILVTATTPTVSGEGKTVTSIGLTQGLAHIGKRAVITSREPSLGPV